MALQIRITSIQYTIVRGKTERQMEKDMFCVIFIGIRKADGASDDKVDLKAIIIAWLLLIAWLNYRNKIGTTVA